MYDVLNVEDGEIKGNDGNLVKKKFNVIDRLVLSSAGF